MGVHGKRQRTAHTPVPLEIGVPFAVEGRSSTREVGGIERRPNPKGEAVNCVPLQGIERILRACVAAEEIVVVAAATSSVQGPTALETPTSGLKDQRLVPMLTSLLES